MKLSASVSRLVFGVFLEMRTLYIGGFMKVDSVMNGINSFFCAVFKKMLNFVRSKNEGAFRGVAQLAARHVRDVEVGSSSLLTPTAKKRYGLIRTSFSCRIAET